MTELWAAKITDWITAVAAIASLVIAATAIYVANRTSQAQAELQKRQLKQDLFEKRYQVYAAVQTWLAYTYRKEGRIDYEDVQKFHAQADPAQFLFGAEIAAFVEEIGIALADAHAAAGKRDRLIAKREDYRAAEKEANVILDRIRKDLSCRQDELFRPYLQLHK